MDLFEQTVTDSRYYDATAQGWAIMMPYLVTFFVVSLLLFFIIIAGFWFLFKKAGEKGWKSIIPFYNFYILFQIADLNPWLSLLLYLPIVGTVMSILMYIKLAKAFGQGTGFAIGLILFPPIFVWLLAASNKYEYQLAKGKNIPFGEAFERPEGAPTPEPTPEEPVPAEPAPEEPTPEEPTPEPTPEEPTDLPPAA